MHRTLFVLVTALFFGLAEAQTLQKLPPEWEATSSGTLLHSESGIALPYRFQGLAATSVEFKTLGPGKSASISYEDRDRSQVITIYIYSMPDRAFDAKAEFEDTVSFALQTRQEATLLDAKQSWIGQPPRRIESAYYSALTWTKDNQLKFSWIIIVPHENWYLKVLTTAPFTKTGDAIGAQFSFALELLQTAKFGDQR